MASPMTLDQILEALSVRPAPEDGPGYRVEEIKNATGMDEKRIRREIQQGLKEGTVRRAARRFVGIDGRHCTVQAYEFLARPPLVKGKKR